VNKKAAKAKADRLFSLKVREIGYCQLAAWFPKIRCNGNLQCCHIISRRYGERVARRVNELIAELKGMVQ
jgi:ABC-type proline/glycine betaine transport system ATPase subunit